MVLLNAIQGILTIVIMISIGYVLTEKKWFNEETSKSFAKLVTNVSLPALMVSDIMGNFTKGKLMNLSKGLIAPFLSIAACYIIAIAVSKILKVQKSRQGTFQSMFFNSNTIFIGLPVNIALFGEKSVPYVLLYYIANTTFFWTLGVYCISKDAPGEHGGILSKTTIKRIISPPLLGFIIAIILVLLKIELPLFIMNTCKYLGNLTTPLSMIFIGISIHSVKLKELKIDKDVIGVLLGRFLVCPLIMIIILILIPIPKLMKDVFIMQSAMPVMTNAPIIAKVYGADSKYAAVMVTLSTVLSMITIPIFMVIMS
ncbi:AEC family transporter [Clostridium neuense]|uniref:AEC family transporter n=1 Tax=Clostridium neuense TaxID=1728934 RepID=A0ABW8TEK2_9CLOT